MCLGHCQDLSSCVCLCYTDNKKDNDEWDVDQKLISKLKEQYQKERKGKKSRPGRSTLQAMLANLGNEDDIPSVQAGAAASSPARSTVSGNSMPDIDDMGVQGGGSLPFSSGGSRKQMMGGVAGPDEDALEALGLGELAGLTPSNEADPVTYDTGKPGRFGDVNKGRNPSTASCLPGPGESVVANPVPLDLL
ncbi:hypothetical protein KUTeg_009187 [Tegillarca granosa]|uniref:Uncharacterized protein n=1 Tax=Tegillarca granosa TaxID=220873 RepID=A0ABQ9FAG8_TEGGR|nr:hypothetical protein KUTeg_009187 [Tegillarca granosa]